MTDSLDGYDNDERALFAALPRHAPITPEAEDRVVRELRGAGYFARGRGRSSMWIGAAAAAGLIVAAWLGGVRQGLREARATSIEGMLTRKDLTRDDRVLLMQRAGSAYVEAAHVYATSVAAADSTAIEVSSQVLLGAAQAVARTGLDGGMASQLASLIRDTRSRSRPPSLIWY
jgi:hypothetical protein